VESQNKNAASMKKLETPRKLFLSSPNPYSNNYNNKNKNKK